MRTLTSQTLLLVCFSVSVGAQGVPQLKLKPADATLAEEFTSIGSVRELADGRVLVTDLRDNRLLVADLKAGTTRGVGRVGSGPGEYRRTGSLLALAADSTLMQDGGNRRWIVLHRDSIVITLPPETPAIRAASFLFAADTLGRVQAPYFARPAPNQPAYDNESTFVLMVRRSTGATDTITRLAPMWRKSEVRERNPDGSPRLVGVQMKTLDGAEQALLFRDGWLGVVRLNPYRVEWRGPSGQVVRGAPLPVPLIPIDEKVKQAYVSRFPPRNGRAFTVADISLWADYVAPVGQAGSLAPLPDGRLLIARQPVGGSEPTRYDIVDRRGTLSGQLVLTTRERVVGIGPKSIYVAEKNDDDIEHMRRHPWP